MTYREFAPSAALRPYVACYWTSRCRGARPVGKRVLPDGCVDILFDLASGRSPFVVGTMTEALVVERLGPERILAVRFRPGGARPFLGVPMSELRDRQVLLDDVMRVDAEPLDRILDARERSTSTGEILRTLDGALSRRLEQIGLPDARVSNAVRFIETSEGRMPVRSVCDALGVTRQHLNRLFVREVGVGTKFFSRVVRFHSALGRVPSFASLRSSSESNSGPASAPESWSSLAIDAGYFDQAHFIDECRALSGLSPTRLIASR